MKKEEENICKIVLFILNIAMGVIRKVIEKKFLKNNMVSFKEHLNQNVHTFFHVWLCRKKCCRCDTEAPLLRQNMLTNEQFDMLFSIENPKCSKLNKKDGIDCSCCIVAKNTASLESLDITLAYCVIKCSERTLTDEDDNEKRALFDWLSVIREYRNKIFHIASSTKLSDVKFINWWQKIKGATIGIANQIDAEFAKDITLEIDKLKCKIMCSKDTDQMHIVLKQCESELSLAIHQDREKRFFAELEKAGISKRFSDFEEDIKIIKSDALFTQSDNISIHILKYPDESMEQDIQTEGIQETTNEKTVDILLRVAAPDTWDEHAILEMIRRMCKQINEGGNVIIKETTLDNFLIIIEILRKTLLDKKLLAEAIRDFLKRVFRMCRIDTFKPSEVSIIMEKLENNEDKYLKHHENVQDEIERLELVKTLTIQKNMNAFITGCAMTNDRKYFFIDSNNLMLVKYDNNTDKLSSLKLARKPWGLALLNNYRLVVSHPDNMEIEIIDISKQNKPDFRKMPGKCYSITAKDENMIWIFVAESGLFEYDIANFELKKMPIDLPNFVPRSDEIDIYKDRLCHTDRTNCRIYCYHISGDFLWSFNLTDHNGLGSRPTAIAFDAFNNVFVADLLKHHLIAISSNGKSYKILLTRKDGIHLPTFVCCCQGTHHVMVANRDDGHVAVYRIQYVSS